MFPKHYSLKQDADKHFEIHDSRDGKTFKIAKKDIHPANQIKMMRHLPKFNEGGVSGSDEVEEQEEVVPDAGDSAGVAMPVPESLPTEPQLPNRLMVGSTQAPPAESIFPNSPMAGVRASSAERQPQSMVKTPAAPNIEVPGMKEAELGLKDQYNAQAAQSIEQQAALSQHQKNMQVVTDKYKPILDNLDKEDNELRKKITEGKVDPHRMYNNMSTGQKIATAIAITLGGIGIRDSGRNLAYDAFQRGIDQDIDSQKAELGKTESLLSHNMRKYGNVVSAEAATRLQYNTTLQTQLHAAESKAKSGLALAQLHMMQGQLKQQAAQYKMAIAGKMANAQSLGLGSGEGGIQEGHEPAQLLLDPKYREARVVVNGKAFQANDKEAAGKVRDVETLAVPVLSGVKELQELANDPSARFAGTPANLRAHGIMGDLAVKLPLLSGATIGAKRVNSEEIRHQLERFQDPTRFDQSMGGIKNDQFFKSLEEEIEGMRSNHLIGYKGMGKIKSFAPILGGKLPRN